LKRERASRGLAARTVLLLATLLVGCGSSEAPPDPVAEAPPTIRRHGGEEEAASEDTEAPPAVLMRSEGDVTVSSGVLTERLPLNRGDRVLVGPGGAADVDVREGARFSLEPGSDMRVGDVGPARVLLVTGAVHIANPPEDGPRAVLRVATPEASLAITGPGEAYLVAHPSGTTVLMVLSGMFAVSTGETDARGRLREMDLTPGRAVVIAQRMSEPVEGPTRLDTARIDAAALLAASTPVDEARRRHDLGTSISRLDEALGTLEAEGRHGGELTEAHRAAVTAANPTESMRLQGELVAHSAQLFRLREVATSRWERLRVIAMTVAGPVEPDPIEVRADRVRGLLGE
jgi:hypothetical protein